MKAVFGLVLAALAAAAGAGPARAGVLYYSFSFSGPDTEGSGLLVTSDAPDPAAPLAGAYDILSLSGTLDGDAITGLVGGVGPAALSADGAFIYDNDFYIAGADSAAGGFFDDDGLLFAAGGVEYNLYFDGDTYTNWTYGGGGVAVNFTAVDPPPPSIPEPASLLGFLSALLLLGLAIPFGLRARRLR